MRPVSTMLRKSFILGSYFEAGLNEASKRLQIYRNVLLVTVEAWLDAGLNNAAKKKLHLGFITK